MCYSFVTRSVWTRVLCLLALLGMLFSAMPAAAVTWDIDQATAGVQGGSGTWDIFGFNWNNGTATNVAWINDPTLSTLQAIFSDNPALPPDPGTALVTLSYNINVETIEFNAPGYVIQDTTGGFYSLTLVDSTLTAGVSPSISAAAGVDATIRAVINSTSGLTKIGDGRLILADSGSTTGNPGLNGPITISAGTLSINNTNLLGAETNGVVLNGGALQATGVVDFTTRTVTLGATGGTLDTVGALRLSADGALIGTTTLTKAGGGVLQLLGNNSATFSGAINLTNGTLVPATLNSLGSAPNLQFNGGRIGAAYGTTFTLSPTQYSGSPAVGMGQVTFTGNATLSAPLTVTAGGVSEAVLPDTASLAGNALNLTGGGRVTVGAAGGTLLTGGGAITGTSLNATKPSHAGTKNILSHIDGNAGTLTLDGDLAVGGNIVNTATLAKGGNGTLVLKGASNSAATINVTGGKLAFTTPAALGTGAVNLSGGTLQVGWTNQGLLGSFYDYDPAVLSNAAVQANMDTLEKLNGLSATLEGGLQQVTRSNIDGRTSLAYPNQTVGNIFAPLGFNVNDDWLARFDGYIDVPTTGDYQFWSSSDDASMLFIDGVLVVNNGGDHGYPGAGAGPVLVTGLTAGMHKITGAVQQGVGGAAYVVDWDLGGTRQSISNDYLYLSNEKYAALSAYTHSGLIDVTGVSGIDLSVMTAAGTAAFSNVALQAGSALDVSGVGRTANLTVNLAGGIADYSLGGSATVNAGALGATNTFTKIGAGNLTYTGTLSTVADFNITSGSIGGAGTTLTVGGALKHTGGSPAKIQVATLNLPASATIDVPAGNQLNIGPTFGSTTVNKTGAGKLVLDSPLASVTNVNVAGNLQVYGATPLAAATIQLNPGATLTPGHFVLGSGLVEYYYNGNNHDASATRPEGVFSATTTGPRRGQEFTNGIANPGATVIPTTWTDNNTWIYKGEVYDADGTFSFAKSIDDGVIIIVDGVTVLDNNTWNATMGTGVLNMGMGPNSDGWHSFEVRFNNGGGGAGAVADATNGWTATYGFGFSAAGTTSIAAANYVAPNDNGSMNLFRNSYAREAATGMSGNNVVTVGDTTIDLYNALPNGATFNFGALTSQADALSTTNALTVTGNASYIVGAAFTGTSFDITNGGDRTFTGGGSLNLGAITPAAKTLTNLTKNGVGALAYSGDLVVTNSVTLAPAAGDTSVGNLNYTGSLSVGAGGLNLAGTTVAGGTLNVAGPINYTGGTAAKITGTAVNLTSGAGVITVAKGTRMDDLTIAAPVSAAALVLDKQGPGRLVLASDGNAVGNIVVNGGTLQLSGTTAIGSSAITLKNSTTLIPGKQIFTPGLQEGRILSSSAGGLDVATANPANSIIRLGTRMGDTSTKDAARVATPATANWFDNETWVYTGRFYDADGNFSFAANIDDSWSIRIDGVVYQANTNNNVWTTGLLSLTPGWHDIDIRFANGTGGAGVTRTANGWVANAIGSGYHPDGTASSNFNAGYIRTIDPGDGSLFRVVTGSSVPAGLDATDLIVEGSATVDLGEALAANGSVALRHLLPTAGSGLAVAGSGQTLVFAGTTIPAGDFTVSGSGTLAFGQITMAGATGVLNVQNTGAAQMNYNATASSLGGLTINVAAGRRLSAMAGAADPTGGATINMADGAIFQLTSAAAGALPLLPNLAIASNATLEHAGPYTNTLGDATHPLTMSSFGTLTLDNTGTGTFILGAAIPANATNVVKTGTGTVLLAGAYNGGDLAINGGKINVNANSKLAAKNVTVNNRGILDYETFSDAPASLTVNAGGRVTTAAALSPTALTVKAGGIVATSGTLSPGSLSLRGGLISLAAGTVPGKLVLSSATTTTSFGGWINTFGAGANPGQLDVSAAGANVFNLYDSGAPEDLTISAQIAGTSGIVKKGGGMLYLAGNNTFSGGITFDPSAGRVGGIAINRELALGDAANVVTLSQTGAGAYSAALRTLYTLTLPGSRVNLGTGTATLDVSRVADANNTLSITGAFAGTSGAPLLIKDGWGQLNMETATAPTTVPTLTVVNRGIIELRATTTALGAAPVIDVDHNGTVVAQNTTNMNLSNVTVNDWTNPSAPGPNAYSPNWESQGSQLRINSNIGNDANSRFPSAPIKGVLDLNAGDLGNGQQLNNADAGTFTMLPKMADGSVLRHRGNTSYINIRLDGNVFLRGGDGNADLRGVLSGTGGLIRVGGNDFNIRAAMTYSGPTWITDGNTFLSSSGTYHGKLVNSTDVRVLAGTLRLDDYDASAVQTDRLNPAAVVSLYGGTFAYRGRNATVLSQMTVPAVDLYGAATIDSIRAQTGSGTTNELTITTLTRKPGGTVSFTGTSLGTAATNVSLVKIGNTGGADQLGTTVTPWAFVNNTDWAVYGANGVTAFTGYTTLDATAGGDRTMAAATTVAAAQSINTLRITSNVALTLNADLSLAAGGLLVNAGNQVSITGSSTARLIAGSETTPKELVVGGTMTNSATGNERSINVTAPIIANGLTKSGNSRLYLNDSTGSTNFNGGKIVVNSGSVEARGPLSINNVSEIVSNGGTVELKSDAATTFSPNIHITNSVYGAAAPNDRNIHAGRIGAGSNLRHTVGSLTVDANTRNWQIRNDNGYSLTFGQTTIGANSYLNLDAGTSTANPWQFGTSHTVTLGDHVFMNFWNGDSEWGPLQLGGSTWARTGNGNGSGRMFLKASAAAGYTATVEIHNGLIQVDGFDALGNNAGATATVVKVHAGGMLNYNAFQTVLPTTVLDRFGAVAGQVGYGFDPPSIALIYGSGNNQIQLPATDAVLGANLTTFPTVAMRGLANDWLAPMDAGTAGFAVAVDPSTSIFKGIASSRLATGAVDFIGDLQSLSGDLELLMNVEWKLRPSSTTAVQQLITPTGHVLVSGPAPLGLAANGSNGVQGNWTTMTRVGDDQTQNRDTLYLDNGANSIMPGKTVTVYDGRVRLYNNDLNVAPGATLNIGAGATLLMHNQNVLSGTVNVLNDAVGYGAVAFNDIGRLHTTLAAGTLVFAPGSTIQLDTNGGNINAALLPSHVNYVVRDDDIKFDTGPLVLNQGMMISTGYGDNGGLNAGKGFAPAPGVTSFILAAPAGRRLAIWDTTFTLPSILQIGTPEDRVFLEGDSFERRLVATSGAVEFDSITLPAANRINMINGGLRLGRDTAAPVGTVVIDGVIDFSVRPAVINGGPVLDIHVGRDGNVAKRVTGTGKVILGMGEDIRMWANEVSANGNVNIFALPIEVLGAGETGTQFQNDRGALTGQLRSERGADSTNDSALARFSKVQMKAGASIMLSKGNENKVMADFELVNDPLGVRPLVFSNDQQTGRHLIGNVTSAAGAGDPERWLELGASIRNGLNDGDLDVVGTLSGNANLAISSRRNVRLTGVVLGGATTLYSSFNLGGRTVALEGGIGTTELYVDPGVGNIDIVRGYMHGGNALDVQMGKNGATWGAGLTINANNDHHQRGILMRVDEVTTAVGLPVTNTFTGLVNVANNGATYIQADRGVDSDVAGFVNTKVALGDNAVLSLRTGNAQNLIVSQATLRGTNSVLSIDSGAAAVQKIVADTGVTNATATVKGTSPNLNLTGTGEIMKAQALTLEGDVTFNPGTGNTANVNSTLNLGTKMTVQTGKVDMGTNVITGNVAARAGGAQPIVWTSESFFRPTNTGINAGATGFTNYGGDPWIALDNAASFQTVTPDATTSTFTGALIYGDAAALGNRARALNGSFGTSNEQLGGMWLGQITVGGVGSPIQPGWVTFGARSDDGSVIYVDYNGTPGFQADERIVDDRGPHGDLQAIGYAQLAAGTYDIGIAMAQGTGGGLVEAKWGPGMIGSFGELQTINPTGNNFNAYTPSGGIVEVVAGSELVAGAALVNQLTINDNAKMAISGTTTSVVNFLQIGNGAGGFTWDAGSGGSVPAGTTGGGAAAAVPEPATWLLSLVAALAGLLAWRRRRA